MVFRPIRPGNTFWYIFNSSSNAFCAQQFELASDRLLSGDYNGDGKTNIAVYRYGMCFRCKARQALKPFNSASAATFLCLSLLCLKRRDL
ncbi:MAG TPA: hypothetical protein VEX64_08870 [Pyrinomonadaceae bacterium]|nr:hypothetical protein [Pyrinomonadaceae bacterium]